MAVMVSTLAFLNFFMFGLISENFFVSFQTVITKMAALQKMMKATGPEKLQRKPCFLKSSQQLGEEKVPHQSPSILTTAIEMATMRRGTP